MGGIQATERLTARVPACAHCGLAGTDGIAQRGAQLFPGSFSSSIFTLPKLLLFEHSSGQAQVFLNPCRGETSAHDCKVPSSFSPKSFRSHVLSSYSVGWTGERHPMQALAAFQEEEFYRRVKRHLFSGVSTSTTDDADGRQRETAGSESSRVSSTSVQNERGCSDRPVCQNCGAISKQKFPILCEDCHTIMKPRYSDAGRNELSYFDLLQIRPDFDVDLRVLDAKYKQLEKRLHPDRHVHAPEEMHEYRDKHRQQIVEAVNTLRCPAKRARHLLECHEGHPCVGHSDVDYLNDIRRYLESTRVASADQ
ncbi:fe-s protein assembly co-chaperone protein [Cystoisospora suis]|uniref:Fe-s protein assembly co-chaperone protein n=1 Tax=Cystoisospora suis TaxID=483139 RepID=A0A2C6JNA8_9APIC|nr:fe-s protein assembly co-chaperone protein [Cystoisospora suis]